MIVISSVIRTLDEEVESGSPAGCRLEPEAHRSLAPAYSALASPSAWEVARHRVPEADQSWPARTQDTIYQEHELFVAPSLLGFLNGSDVWLVVAADLVQPVTGDGGQNGE